MYMNVNDQVAFVSSCVCGFSPFERAAVKARQFSLLHSASRPLVP